MTDTSGKYTNALGERMKSYESEFTGPRIDNGLPFVMRLDGHAFSRFTRGLHKPYDYNFQQVFCDTCKALAKAYRADIAYTHSDEISLVFYPRKTRDGRGWREAHFGGRIQKIISTAAAFCTMTFNKVGKQVFAPLAEQYVGPDDGQVKGVYTRIIEGCAYFDCRIFTLPTEVEVFSYLFWRSQSDCRKNHVFELARRHFTKKELHGVGTTQRIRMLETKGVKWEDEPACFRRGTFFKRVRKVIPDRPEVVRFEFREVPFDLVKFSEQVNERLKAEVLELEQKEQETK